jgi:hypothetical protein
MTHSIQFIDDELHVEYSWKHRKQWNKMNVVAEASLNSIEAGSEEEFIFEHYWGYNKYNDHTTIEYGVEHEMWQIHEVKSFSLDCNIASLYGHEFVPYLTAKPTSVFLAKGSDVVIRKPRFIRQA